VSGEDFLSGASGEVSGIRASGRALARDARDDAGALLSARARRLRRASSGSPERRVLALGIERAGEPNLLAHSFAELRRSRHEVVTAAIAMEGRGKWENVGLLLERHPPEAQDWLLVVDDDVRLPHGFLDAFLFLAERFGLAIAQPAHRARSHAAWAITRRRPGLLARETTFVESGPLVAFHRTTFEALLPFPPLRAGWGLDAHWSAVARSRGWRIGIVDATPVGHGMRRIAASYDRGAAIAEAREFLASREYVRASEVRTLAAHRRWR
jgi:hypothetical protein